MTLKALFHPQGRGWYLAVVDTDPDNASQAPLWVCSVPREKYDDYQYQVEQDWTEDKYDVGDFPGELREIPQHHAWGGNSGHLVYGFWYPHWFKNITQAKAYARAMGWL